MALSYKPVNKSKPANKSKRRTVAPVKVTKPFKPNVKPVKVKPAPEPVEIPTISDMDTLHCAAGHSWERRKQRGRKPNYCPMHKPDNNAPVNKPEPKSEPKREAKAKVTAEKSQGKTRFHLANDAMNHPRITDDEYRQIRYIVAQMASGKRKLSEITHLTERLDQLIRQVTRRK